MAHTDASTDPRSLLLDWVQHLEHVLPGQAPIKDFVHHNTLHGFQHLAFPDALAAARRITGASGYLPAQRYRELLRAGRIDRADLEASLRDLPGLDPDAVVLETASVRLRQLDIQLAALAHSLAPLSTPRLAWEAQHNGAFERLQADIGEASRQRLLAAAAGDEKRGVAELWAACLEVLGLDVAFVHPEELVERFDRDDHDDGNGRGDGAAADEPDAAMPWDALERRLGADWTVRDLLLALTGEDVLEAVQPTLVRQLAAHLDQGLAAWHHPLRGLGFYACWRGSAAADPSWMLQEMSSAQREIAASPDDAADAVVQELDRLELPRERWTGYLERLALELPGWSGMFLWRHMHPGYGDGGGVPVAMMDYLAVRLLLERLAAEAVVRRHWDLPLRLSRLGAYFRGHGDELAVRLAYNEGMLPEYVANMVERRVERGRDVAVADGAAWTRLARQVRAARGAVTAAGRSAGEHAWPLFVAAQHLGIAAGELRAAGRSGAQALLSAIARLDADAAGLVWLQAYERHYREQIFAALAANHGRCPPSAAPRAQLVFCMDDREEGLRRHLEEINPQLETFGAAAHFNVFMNWRGLDDDGITPLCPVTARPSHEVRELPRPEAEAAMAEHRRRRALRRAWTERVHQGTRLSLVAGLALAAAAAPFALGALVLRTVVPSRLARLASGLRRHIDGTIPTRIEINLQSDLDMPVAPATPDRPRWGYTDGEQAERVQALLRNIGLTRNFAPLVVIAGHGSWSQNNPHLAAYDCGACSGRHSGPNARLLAAMANRPAVRGLLAARDIVIPEASWFIGAEHDTCGDGIEVFDVEDIPPSLAPAFAALQRDLAAAGRAHARERCRRFASAAAAPTLDQAWWHVEDRRNDYSEARPELGHATNAAVFIGRRSMSRGAFFDRRAFLISYDPAADSDGRVLEGLLLANAPVGAGISLEYYFSTVNNEYYGCGSKTLHNVVGLFGVMQGASSDLRTGLPRQMIEIHEPMRLLVVVEAGMAVVTAICERQPPLQDLIGGGWIIVAAKDPASAAIHLFHPGRGWLPWQGEARLKTVDASFDWFRGKRDALPPVLLTRPLEFAA